MKHRISRWRLALIAIVAAALPAACRAIVGIEGGDPYIWSSTGAGAAGGGDDAGDTDATTAFSCATYCEQVTASCTEDNRVFPTNDACLALCPHLTLGTTADTDMNTIGCRYGTAKSIFNNGEIDLCPAVGPGGNDLCGTNCDAYCELMKKVCPGSFVDDAACDLECGKVPDKKDYHVTSSYLPDDYSIQCRLRHVSSAAIDMPELHCMHAVGIGKCAPPTDGGAD